MASAKSLVVGSGNGAYDVLRWDGTSFAVVFDGVDDIGEYKPSRGAAAPARSATVEIWTVKFWRFYWKREAAARKLLI